MTAGRSAPSRLRCPTQGILNGGLRPQEAKTINCHRWIAEHLSGTFAAGIAKAGMPTVETFVCDLATPFERQDFKGHTDYRMVLDIDNDSDAYMSPSLPGWRLSAWGARAPDEPFVLRLGARWTDVNNEELSAYGGASQIALARRLTHPLFTFSTRFALQCLCSGYEEHLSDIRDRIASVRRQNDVVGRSRRRDPLRTSDRHELRRPRRGFRDVRILF